MYNSFSSSLLKEIVGNMDNHHGDNYDVYRFGQTAAQQKALGVSNWLQNFESIDRYMDGLQNTFALLSDEESKYLLSRLFAYRILGHHKVRLPLSQPFYWEMLAQLSSLVQKKDTRKLNFLGWSLDLFDLNPMGFPLLLNFTAKGVLTIFGLEHYCFKRREPAIGVQAGDYVIDGGGCWGDSSLYFAAKTGAEGRVYTFEVLPGNLEIASENFSLNPHLAPRITTVQRALWNVSNETLHFSDNGPGTSLLRKPGELAVRTITIDDFVEQNAIPKIDFIKMDIEGAEPNALRGAEKTLRKYKPKLAICLYHNISDFVTIPQYLAGLNLGYRFYVEHYSIHQEETILFAS